MKPPKHRSKTQTSVGADRPLEISSIERDPAINCRAGGVVEQIAEQYRKAMFPPASEEQKAVAFPPVVVFRDPDGKHWLADGWHRVRAHELAGKTEISAEVREGDRRAALLYAAGANASHGARRSHKDKRRAVEALFADPEWFEWGDGVIADRLQVSQPFVSTLRRAWLKATQKDSDSRPRRGKDGRITKGPKPKRKAEIKPERAARIARRALDRVAKEWPRGMALDLLVVEAGAWLRALDSQSEAPL